jgi:uncharacterized YkwD family protein
MKKFRNLLMAAVAVLFFSTSVAPVGAATPSYATQYSWSGYKYNVTTNTTTQKTTVTPKANGGYAYNYYSYRYSNPTYSYKPVTTVPTTTKPVTMAPVTTKPVTTTPTTTTTKPASATITAAEQQMVNLVNKERTNRGLAALQVDMQLVKVARMKSQDMIDNNYFGHQSAKYGSPFDMMKSQGITYRYAGENLAGADTVQRAHTNLMNSEGHRKNILNPNFTKIGIGVVQGGPYGLMISQEFTG